VRLAGTNVDEGRRIIAECGLPIIPADTLAEAAHKAVAASRGGSAGDGGQVRRDGAAP
jgi:malate-CoA ligase subunit beta